jgi:hypothetical protein
MHSLGSFRDTPDSKLLQWRSQDFEVGGTIWRARSASLYGGLGVEPQWVQGQSLYFLLEFTPLNMGQNEVGWARAPCAPRGYATELLTEFNL